MTTAEAGLIFHIASYFSFPVLLKVFAGSAFHVPMLPLPDVSTFQCLSLEQRAGVRAWSTPGSSSGKVNALFISQTVSHLGLQGLAFMLPIFTPLSGLWGEGPDQLPAVRSGVFTSSCISERAPARGWKGRVQNNFSGRSVARMYGYELPTVPAIHWIQRWSSWMLAHKHTVMQREEEVWFIYARI